ncbi:MAG: phosphodiesterase YaeI [Verrucomicrobia bacterium]|nr:phosphodiesterase YaeI [Verrucomicrobiota bacterium]
MKGLSLAGAGTVVTGGYGKAIESEWLEVGRHTIKLSKVPGQQSLKILHLSDLHASNMVSLEFIEKAINLGLREKPDLICLTGDYITRKYNDWEGYAGVLSALPKAAPTFATLGNHDGGAWCGIHNGYEDSHNVRNLFDKSGIAHLDNATHKLELRGWKMNLVGLGDIWEKDFQPRKAFSGCDDASCVTTVLSHNPDTKDDLRPYKWNLMLSGHTHGGQVELPFFGAPIAPVKDRRFIKGLHQWDNRWLNVTKGIGNLYGIRINCRPEVSLLTLV